MRISAWAACSFACLTTCCGDPGRGAQGTVQDSAGVRLIELPPVVASSAPFILRLDSAWSPARAREFGELLDVAILPDGRAVLLERYEAKVFVTSPDGQIQAEFGAAGEGPGEFNPSGLSRVVVTDSSVFVPDLFQQRVTEFAFDGTLLGTRRYPGEGVYAVDWRRHPKGGLALRVLDRNGDRLLRMTGERIDTIHAFPPLAGEPNMLLSAVPLWDLAGERLITATSDVFAVQSSDLGGGQASWVARRETGSLTFTEADRTAVEAVLLASVAREAGGAAPSPAASAGVLAQVSFPETRPALAGLRLTANGDVWVREAVSVESMGREALRVGSAGGYGGAVWDVLTASGLLRERLRLPDGFTVTRVADRWVYGIAADEYGGQRPARVALPW